MDEFTLNTFTRLGVSLALGMFIGLQREKAASGLAGLRSFALVSIVGTLAAILDRHFESGGWILASALIAIAAVVVVGQWQLSRRNSGDIGMTTAITVVAVFCIGAYLAEGTLIVGAAIGVAIAALLQFKPDLHSVARKLGDRDMRAIMQFAVFSCVILPVLPNENMGPLNVFNPFNIWLMVVLIVGISLAGYIAYKFFGQSAGVIVGGILGGAISSTATTVSYSKKGRSSSPAMLGVSTAVIIIASSIVFVRVIIELVVVTPGHLLILGTPIAVMLAVCIISAIIAWWMFRGQTEELPEPTNPSEFKSAVMFGVLYALVLWALAATRQYLSDDAMYVVAAVSGLTDMDAITLSTGRMVEQTSGELSPQIGWRLLVTASISNLIFKSAIVAFVGGYKLFVRVFALFLLPIVCGGLLLAFGNFLR